MNRHSVTRRHVHFLTVTHANAFLDLMTSLPAKIFLAPAFSELIDTDFLRMVDGQHSVLTDDCWRRHSQSFSDRALPAVLTGGKPSALVQCSNERVLIRATANL